MEALLPGSLCVGLLGVLWALERKGVIRCALTGFGLIKEDEVIDFRDLLKEEGLL